MSAPALPARGLYAITDHRLSPPDVLTGHVAAAIDGGACVIQYRDKRPVSIERTRGAAALAELCNERGVALIINDDIELALEVQAAGVHLGRDDAPVGRARERLGEGAILGVSCYNQLDIAAAAVRDGASYIAFGRFFPSHSKPEAVQAGVPLLKRARTQFDVPIAVIGGITPENGRQLVKAGADLLAVIHGVFGQADIESAARQYIDCFLPTPR